MIMLPAKPMMVENSVDQVWTKMLPFLTSSISVDSTCDG